MKRKLLFLLLFSFALKHLIGQPDTTILFKPRINLASYSLVSMSSNSLPLNFTWHRYNLENESRYKNIGIFGDNLRPYLQSDYQAIKYLDKYKCTKIAGVSQMAAGMVFSFTAITIAVNYTNSNTNNSDFCLPNSVPILAISGGLLIFSGNITYSDFTNKKIKKAVEIYNQNLY